MAYRLEIVLHGLPRLGQNARGHWRLGYEQDRRWKRAVVFAVGRNLPERPLERARVVMTRFSSVEPEPETLCGSFKAILDAIRLGHKHDGLPILIDDRRENFVGGRPDYRWEKAPPGRGRVTVLVEEVPDDGEGESPFDHAA